MRGPTRPVGGTPGLAVCHVISSFRPVVGGAERVTETVCRGLLDRGTAVWVLTRRYPGTDSEATYDGLVVRRLGIASRGKIGALTFGLHALWELATSLKHCQVVHTSTNTPLLVGLLAKLLLRRGLVVTVHTDPTVVFGKVRRTGPLRLRVTNALADTVVALSSFIRDRLVEQGLSADRVVVVPNAVDTRRFSPPAPDDRERSRSDLGLPKDELVYLFVGRLERVKGVDLLLRAWSRLESGDRRLVVVGDGPQRRELQRLAVALGIPSVEFTGATGRTDRYMRAADAFVLPSRREGQSVALLEAMATGLPAVASDVGGNRSLIEDGRNGLLFEAGSVDALSHKLRVVEDDGVRRRLGREAVELVRRKHSARASADRHLQLYREIAGQPRCDLDADPPSAERETRGHSAGGDPSGRVGQMLPPARSAREPE